MSALRIYGPAFSPEVLATEPTPFAPSHLLPWLLKDRREAVEGAYRVGIGKDGQNEEHDRMGLDYATRELRRIERDLRDLQHAHSHNTDRAAILTIQRTQQQAAVQFWEGKIRLLDRVIEAARAGA